MPHQNVAMQDLTPLGPRWGKCGNARPDPTGVGVIGAGDRPRAPFGRRDVPVTGSRRVGAYVVFSCQDVDGPVPRAGQFYMVAAEQRWGAGDDGRPYLPRALSFARAAPSADGQQLEFVIELVGPGTERLGELTVGDNLHLNGPFGNGFDYQPTASALLVGGGVGVAPLLALNAEITAAGGSARVMLGFRGAEHAAATTLFDCEVELTTDDGSAGSHGLVTQLLDAALDGSNQVVYSCGPPAMLEAVRELCSERDVPVQLALESGMACGFGACFGCVVPTRDGYVRLCVDGPVLDGRDLDSALVAGAGH